MGRRAKLGRFFTPPDDFAVLDVLTAKICRVLGAPACCIMLYEASEERLTVVSAQGMPFAKETDLQESDPVARWLNSTTTPLAVNDLGSEQVDRSFVLLPEAGSMLWVPIFVAAQVCGALAAFHREKDAFFGSDVDILDLITSQVASIIELYVRMDEVTVTDFLTGLVSQPYFLERVKEESLRSERYGSPVSLVKVAFKSPKRLDTALQRKILPQTADRLKEMVRRSDIITRSGEWSFSVILAETGAQGAEVVAKKLEQEMHGLAAEAAEQGADLGVESTFICYPETEADRERFVTSSRSAGT